MKMENGINRLANIGIRSEMTTEQKELLKLSNIIAWSVLLFCAFFVILGLFTSEYITAIYDLTLAILVFITIVMNYYKMHTAAKLMLIYSAILWIIGGAMLYGYDSVFKYLMILPISITFIFFSEESKWKLYFPISFIILSLVIFEIDKFYNHNFTDKNFNDNFSGDYTGHILESMTFMILIFLYILIQLYFRSILKKKESELMIYKKIFDNSHEGLSIVDTKGRYVKQNNAHEEILGFTDKELVSKTAAIHMGEELFNEIAETLKKTGNYKGEFISKTKFGEKHIDLMAFVIIENNKAMCIVGIKRDITERKITELALKESEAKLQENNKTKDKLFSIIAHDLRSPFNGILGFSDLLINITNSQDTEKTKKYSSLIYSTARNTLVLLDNLLDWGKSQTGQINFNPEKLILSSIIQNVVETSRSNAIIKNISLNFIPSGDIAVYADQNMLETVLRNLTSNAIKFTNLNGEININAIQNQDFCEITISDNGVGMNDEKCNRLFNLDTNITTIGTANEKGSGLGLILCKEFVEKLDGNIWVESKEGKGSNFKFTLPLSK
jgi:PAS domain S-box-containing protein